MVVSASPPPSARGGEDEPALSPRDRARLELLTTAERLFSRYGIGNVSLRQIALAAGYSNPATVQYHFGSKEGLCEAIVEHRLAQIDARRQELLDDLEPDDFAGFVAAFAKPLLEHDPDSEYIGFLARTIADFDDRERAYYAARFEGSRRAHAAINRLLADVPPAIRSMRLNLAAVMMVNAIAERRARSDARGAAKAGARKASAATRQNDLGDEDFERELMRAIAAILQPDPISK
jgi:AcrR family transcriptional regulator